jgi:hypothetical protein
MLSIFQQMINEAILERYKDMSDKTKTIVGFLLSIVHMTPSLCVDTCSMTTHSLPSGIWITAQYNSLIHKAYTFYVFCATYFDKYKKLPTISYYMSNVYNGTYGDDGLNGVSEEVKDYFNGPAMATHMKSLGLDYTPADKGEWKYSTRRIEECSFLKRDFKFHSELGRVVAPLSLRTITSTLNYVRDDFRNTELTRDKLYNFQREAYLHELLYPELMRKVSTFCDDSGFEFIPLTRNYLKELYTDTNEYSGCMVSQFV